MELIYKLEKLIQTWKPIDGYPNYKVSSFGNVKNIKTDKILKPGIDKDGYYQVYLSNNGNGKTIKIHKLVANAFIKNPENKKCVDHINNNKIDNHIHNLRFCTNSENQMNKKKQSNNSSGFTGVYFKKDKQKWCSHIKINGKFKHLGYFDTIEEAAKVRKQKANEIFGEFCHSSEKI